jgi:hypothetical protein
MSTKQVLLESSVTESTHLCHDSLCNLESIHPCHLEGCDAQEVVNRVAREDFEDQPTHGAEIIEREGESLVSLSAALAEYMGRVQAKLSAELTRLEGVGLEKAGAVNAIKPTDESTYHELYAKTADCDQFKKDTEAFIEPWKQLFYRPYKAVLEAASGILIPPAGAIIAGRLRILAFERALKLAAEQETMRLQAEQRKRDEEAKLAAATVAEASGMSEAAVDAILEAPSIAPMPMAQPQFSRPSGFRKPTENWSAEWDIEKYGTEAKAKAAFWAWARRQKDMPAQLLLDRPAMNREAKTHQATLAIRFPGFRGVKGGKQ